MSTTTKNDRYESACLRHEVRQVKILRARSMSAYDRPYYETLRRLSVQNLAGRVRVAALLIRGRMTDCRAFDNCFEMGDADKVIAQLARMADHGDTCLTAFMGAATVAGETWLDKGRRLQSPPTVRKSAPADHPYLPGFAS